MNEKVKANLKSCKDEEGERKKKGKKECQINEKSITEISNKFEEE